MRAVLLVAAMALVSNAVAAPSKQKTSANERAYTLTLMCAVVASDGSNDADKLRVMDAVRKMAKANGYTTARVAKDSIAMANVLGNEARTNPNAMNARRETCRRLALIG